MGKEKVQFNVESLDEAIEAFNEWSKAASIYYNKADNTFDVDVFANDVHASGSFNVNEDIVHIHGKNEIDSNRNIGAKRKEYIIKFAEMLNDGYEAYEAEYHLTDLYA